MKLYHAAASPFARKVRVLVREKGLLGRVEEINLSPLADPPELHAANPLGKVPALVLADSTVLFDSPVICEYLDTISGSPRLLPKEGERRWQLLRVQALADGIMDAAVALVYESRRPEAQRSPDWDRRWRACIHRALVAMSGNASVLAGPLHLGSIAIACALGYLDFRLPDIDWRGRHRKLVEIYTTLSATPAMQETQPQ